MKRIENIKWVAPVLVFITLFTVSCQAQTESNNSETQTGSLFQRETNYQISGLQEMRF